MTFILSSMSWDKEHSYVCGLFVRFINAPAVFNKFAEFSSKMDKQFSPKSESSVFHNKIEVRLNDWYSPKLKECTALFDKFKTFTLETQVTFEELISVYGNILWNTDKLMLNRVTGQIQAFEVLESNKCFIMNFRNFVQFTLFAKSRCNKFEILLLVNNNVSRFLLQ